MAAEYSPEALVSAIQFYDHDIEQWRNGLDELYRTHESFKPLEQKLATITDKVRHKVMVSIGPHAFMPGYLQHTNDLMVDLGAGYTAKVSAKQALGIVQRRREGVEKDIKQKQSMLNTVLVQRSQAQRWLQATQGTQEVKADDMSGSSSSKPGSALALGALDSRLRAIQATQPTISAPSSSLAPPSSPASSLPSSHSHLPPKPSVSSSPPLSSRALPSSSSSSTPTPTRAPVPVSSSVKKMNAGPFADVTADKATAAKNILIEDVSATASVPTLKKKEPLVKGFGPLLTEVSAANAHTEASGNNSASSVLNLSAAARAMQKVEGGAKLIPQGIDEDGEEIMEIVEPLDDDAPLVTDEDISLSFAARYLKKTEKSEEAPSNSHKTTPSSTTHTTPKQVGKSEDDSDDSDDIEVVPINRMRDSTSVSPNDSTFVGCAPSSKSPLTPSPMNTPAHPPLSNFTPLKPSVAPLPGKTPSSISSPVSPILESATLAANALGIKPSEWSNLVLDELVNMEKEAIDDEEDEERNRLKSKVGSKGKSCSLIGGMRDGDKDDNEQEDEDDDDLDSDDDDEDDEIDNDDGDSGEERKDGGKRRIKKRVAGLDPLFDKDILERKRARDILREARRRVADRIVARKTSDVLRKQNNQNANSGPLSSTSISKDKSALKHTNQPGSGTCAVSSSKNKETEIKAGDSVTRLGLLSDTIVEKKRPPPRTMKQAGVAMRSAAPIPADVPLQNTSTSPSTQRTDPLPITNPGVTNKSLHIPPSTASLSTKKSPKKRVHFADEDEEEEHDQERKHSQSDSQRIDEGQNCNDGQTEITSGIPTGADGKRAIDGENMQSIDAFDSFESFWAHLEDQEHRGAIEVAAMETMGRSQTATTTADTNAKRNATERSSSSTAILSKNSSSTKVQATTRENVNGKVTQRKDDMLPEEVEKTVGMPIPSRVAGHVYRQWTLEDVEKAYEEDEDEDDTEDDDNDHKMVMNNKRQESESQSEEIKREELKEGHNDEKGEEPNKSKGDDKDTDENKLILGTAGKKSGRSTSDVEKILLQRSQFMQQFMDATSIPGDEDEDYDEDIDYQDENDEEAQEGHGIHKPEKKPMKTGDYVKDEEEEGGPTEEMTKFIESLMADSDIESDQGERTADSIATNKPSDTSKISSNREGSGSRLPTSPSMPNTTRRTSPPASTLSPQSTSISTSTTIPTPLERTRGPSSTKPKAVTQNNQQSISRATIPNATNSIATTSTHATSSQLSTSQPTTSGATNTILRSSPVSPQHPLITNSPHEVDNTCQRPVAIGGMGSDGNAQLPQRMSRFKAERLGLISKE